MVTGPPGYFEIASWFAPVDLYVRHGPFFDRSAARASRSVRHYRTDCSFYPRLSGRLSCPSPPHGIDGDMTVSQHELRRVPRERKFPCGPRTRRQCATDRLPTGLAALADPTRWIIFQRTLSKPRSVCDLATGLPVSRPAVSQHLRILKEAGLVTCRRHGRRRLYSADLRAVGDVISILKRMQRDAAEARASVGQEAKSAPVSLLRTNP